MLVGGLVVLEFSINKKNNCCVFLPYKKLGFCSLGLTFNALDYCFGRSNIYGFWAFLEGLESSSSAAVCFSWRVSLSQLRGWPLPMC
ncbi:hypothetical protein NC653_028605 [Populus alba x Populus x berolinensis]|uniref:Uncharacterized protein n=1 Tax=Populus alba x Populus x berolinensis TaxID=444605 RepID=A0AAD6M0C1_9ROSI|nr:hypothetical protein NC653_028605 [Populus alba x Populus x berolinensis]